MDHSCCLPTKRWYEKKVWWVVSACLFFGLISLWVGPLVLFANAFWDYLRLIGGAILIGLAVGGVIDHYVSKEFISKILAQPAKRTVFYATGLGLLASTCSHGILALSMELHKKGASGPAVISFLLASPWANLPVTILLIGLFGWKGILIILAAFMIALNTGLTLQWLDRKGWIEKNKNTVLSDSPNKEIYFKRGFSIQDLSGIWKGMLELAEMVLGWVIFGVVLASLAQAYIPTHIFHQYLGPNLLGFGATLIFAALLEVCSEGTAPLAFEIYRQTQALGNSFVFLCGGVLMDYTEIALVWANVGGRTALWMVLIGIPQVLVTGVLFNLIF